MARDFSVLSPVFNSLQNAIYSQTYRKADIEGLVTRT